MPDHVMMMADADLSYRQLGYWTRQGWLHADNPECGSGNTMTWPRRERDIALIMQRLIRAGFSVPKAAAIARLAATSASDGRATIRIARGIVIRIEGEPL